MRSVNCHLNPVQNSFSGRFTSALARFVASVAVSVLFVNPLLVCAATNSSQSKSAVIEVDPAKKREIVAAYDDLPADAQAASRESDDGSDSDIEKAPFAFNGLAVLWSTSKARGPFAVKIEVRASPDGFSWSEWQEASIDSHLSNFEVASISYTSNLISFETLQKYIQYRIKSGEKYVNKTLDVERLRFFFIDSGTTVQASKPEGMAADVTKKSLYQGADGAIATLVGDPTVISRTSWGAPEGQSSPRWEPQYTSVSHLIVHHTATTNLASDWPGQVRSIWEFHANHPDRQWGDIGYNYLIDPLGNIYEGRAGGDNVIGAHFSCQNSNTMGVALLGTFTSIAPTAAAIQSLERLFAWKAEQGGLNPLGIAFHGGTALSLQTISGHRDANPSDNACSATVCPGGDAYNLLPAIRQNVHSLLTGAIKQPDLEARSLALSSASWSLGDEIVAYWDVLNTGSALAEGSGSGVYISMDATITTSDTLLASKPGAGAMPAGAVTPEGVAFTNDLGLAAGSYWVGIIADNENAVSESEEGNNVSNVVQVSIEGSGAGAGGPDFEVRSLSLSSSSWSVGAEIVADWEVVNTGTAEGESARSSVYLSTNETVTTSDTLLGSAPETAIMTADEVNPQSAKFTYDLGLAAGTYWIGVLADDENAVSESDEENNGSEAIQVVVEESPASYQLTISVDGAGTVSLDLGAYICGDTCVVRYSEGTVVSLQAQVLAESSFDRWGGACSGSGSCVIEITADESVTATFSSDTEVYRGIPPAILAEIIKRAREKDAE
ncbi:MAG: N-acetylmuramoyl-L-alanine amidase [Pseudomonadota bacterium]